MALNQSYHQLWFESFRLNNKSGHTSEVQLKIVADQNLPLEISNECKKRQVDPYSLLTECSRDLLRNHAVGTRFLLKAKLTDREGSGLFMYNYHGWEPISIKKPGNQGNEKIN